MIRYFELTDEIRQGEIIRQEGRKHYRFSFGPFQWERTTIFQAYITEGTPLCGQYRELGEDAAQEQLMQRGKQLSRMLEKAEKISREAHAHQTGRDGQPYLPHIQAVAEALPDWEEKTTAWLKDICQYGGWTGAELYAAGFDGKICRSIGLLTPVPTDTYAQYLNRLRMDRIARRVKIAELAHYLEAADEKKLTQQEQTVLDTFREARKYLFGDIPACTEAGDVSAYYAPRGDMVPAQAVYQRVYPLALGGRKIPHGVSNPVLHRREGQLNLAFFVYTYTKNQLQQGFIGRPVSWILADLASGRIIEEISCSRTDFSSAPYTQTFSVHNPGGPKDSGFFRETYAILDEVRGGCLKGQPVDMDRYGEYLEKILLGVPPSYHCFYRELSNP